MNERAQAIGITASRFAPPGEVGRRQAITGGDTISLGAHMLNDAPAVREGLPLHHFGTRAGCGARLRHLLQPRLPPASWRCGEHRATTKPSGATRP
jgi:hypothetical protein